MPRDLLAGKTWLQEQRARNAKYGHQPMPMASEMRAPRDLLAPKGSGTPREEAPGWVEDAFRSTGAGIRGGLEAAVGLPGDLWSVKGELDALVDDVLFGTGDQTRAYNERRLAPPTTADVRGVTDSLIGKAYEPQYRSGEYFRTAGEFLPAAVAGPGGVGRKVAMSTVPAVASESAGQLTHGTNLETAARVVGAVAGSGGAALITPRGPAGNLLSRTLEGTPSHHLDDAERLFTEAANRGVPITRAEAIQQVTGGATRAGDLQRIVEGRGELRDFFAARPGQVERSARAEMDAISPPSANPTGIGPAIGRTAEGMVQDTRKAINDATEPMYVNSAPARLSPAEFRRVQAAPGWAEARDAVRNDPQLARYVKGMPDDSVGFLNEVQKYLHTQADNAAGPLNAMRNQQRAAGYGSDAKIVRNAAERASPDFARAVSEQARLREMFLDPMMQGQIGRMAKSDLTTREAINALFPVNPLPNSQDEIARTVGALAKRTPSAARQLVRAHAESVFNRSTRELQSGANQFGGATFRSALIGNPQGAANLEAAIRALPNGDQTWTGFNRFLDILEATGTRQRIGSQTAFNTEALQQMKRGTSLEAAGKVAAGGFLTWPRKALETVENWRLGRNAGQLAQLLVDPRKSGAFRSLAVNNRRVDLARTALAIAMMGGAILTREHNR